MRILNAVSLSPHVNDWLSNTVSSSILHVFEQACNLINERGDILSVVGPFIGDGPFNLVVDPPLSFPEHLKFESPVSVHGSRLFLGQLSINTAKAKKWNPRPDWEALHALKRDIVDALPGLQAQYLDPPGLPASSSLAAELCSSISRMDVASARTVVSKLAGLGYGLTPAGDDYILGALHAAWIIHAQENAATLGMEIATTAAARTTSLSAAWLRSAGNGDAGVLWHKLFDTLVGNDGAQLRTSVKRILAVGETSGADALAGFVGVLRSWVNQAGHG